MSSMKFCCSCDNILYPKEDKEHHILLYVCHHCDHEEEADNHCIYANEVHHSLEERSQLLQDMSKDPKVRCRRCHQEEAVSFEATPLGEEGVTLFFCCNPNCGHRWRENNKN